MFGRRRNFNAATLLEFQIVAIFLISESLESPTPMGMTLDENHVPSEFPRYSKEAAFQGAPILDMKTFESNSSFRDVINAINQIIRQKSNLENQPTPLQSALEDRQPNRTGPTIHYIQNITIYQNPSENTRWFLLAATVILLSVLCAFSSRRRFFKKQYSSREHLIRYNEFKDPKNVIDRK